MPPPKTGGFSNQRVNIMNLVNTNANSKADTKPNVCYKQCNFWFPVDTGWFGLTQRDSWWLSLVAFASTVCHWYQKENLCGADQCACDHACVLRCASCEQQINFDFENCVLMRHNGDAYLTCL